MTVLAAWLFADLLSGIFHFIEDTYLDRPLRCKILEGIRIENDLHHARPTDMLRSSILRNMTTTAPYAWSAALISFFLGLNEFFTLGFFFAGFANVVHRWSHTGRVHLFVRFLQNAHVFCPHGQHFLHHRSAEGRLLSKSEARINYCVMSGMLNPILDAIGLWDAVKALTGRRVPRGRGS